MVMQGQAALLTIFASSDMNASDWGGEEVQRKVKLTTIADVCNG
jgi:hypothetical protein